MEQADIERNETSQPQKVNLSPKARGLALLLKAGYSSSVPEKKQKDPYDDETVTENDSVYIE